MSVISRIFGKSPPASDAPPADEAQAQVAAPPPDPAARLHEEEASVTQAIAAGDMAAVGRWVLEGSSTRIRQLAARSVVDLDQLHELIRATRHGKDNTVYRILTGKRDELLAAIRSAQQLQAEVEDAAAAIAQHAGMPCDAAYEPALARLESRWQSLLPHASPELQHEVEMQLERAHQALERHRAAAAAEAERQRAAALAAEEARRQRELEAQAAAAEAAEQARRLEAEREAARQAEQARLEAEAARVRELVALLRQAQSALDHGGTARAARLRESIAGRLAEAPALPVWYAHQLQKVDEKLEELKDWKTFRVAPKRTELLQRMQALVGADMSPEELARQIRRLRDEWRSLHRGAGEEPTPEDQQFEDAAERAYEPCREHFARQAGQRRENQARREELLERLAAFAAGQNTDQPDWRAIARVLAEARQEWRQYAPVDQAVVKSLQARFHEVVKGLESRLAAEHARNADAKRALIARAASLIGLEDTRQAIEQAKSLQREWKTVGPALRHQDNALWEEFRRHCDAVFQRSAQEYAAHAASLDTGQARAIAMCEELEQLAGLGGQPLLEAAPRLEALYAEFDSLELPRAAARSLRQRFARASERCEATLRRHHEAAARRAWSDVLAVAGRLREYALATVEGRSGEECDAMREAAAAALHELSHAPKEARAALERQVARLAAGPVDADLDANEAALRLLCVRAELVAGVDTPPQDQELRREYQMQRLVASMSRGERVSAADLDALALEWIAVGPVEPAAHAALQARFERCREGGRS